MGLIDANGEHPAAGVKHVLVENLPPSVSITGLTTVDEGTTIQLGSDVNDPGSADTHAYAWTVTKDNVAYASGDASELSFLAANDGEYVISLTVTDDDGGSDSKTSSVTVVNVAPSFEAGPDETLPPGENVLSRPGITFTDPGDDVWTATVDYGDGSDVQSLAIDQQTKQFDLIHTYLTREVFTVTVVVSDDDTSYTDSFVVTLNTSPTPKAGGPYWVNEGGEITLDASATDDAEQDPATLAYAWDFDNDGDYDDADGMNPSFSAALIDGLSELTIGLRVTDSSGATATTTTVITVDNVAPTPVIDWISATRLEGTQIDVTASATDPAGTNDVLTYVYEVFKDGSDTAFAAGSGVDQTAFSFTPDDDGSYQVKLTVSDGDGGSTAVSQTITVDNVAPTISLSGAASVTEGSLYTLTLGAVTDPGDDTIQEYVVNWGDGGWSTYTAAGEVTHTYADDLASPTITVDLVDEDGTHMGAGSLALTVDNAAPALVPGSVTMSATKCSNAGIGEVITLSAGFTDHGILDTHTIVIDWGDATASDSNLTPDDFTAFVDTIGGVDGSFTVEHAYSTGGIFTVTITVIDDGAQSGTTNTEAWVTGVRVDPTTGELQIVGTPGKDIVTVTRIRGGSDGGCDGGKDHGKGHGSDGGKDHGRNDPKIKVVANFNVPGGSDGHSDGGADIFLFEPTEVESIRVVLCDGDDHANIGTGGSDGGSDGGADWAVPAWIEGNCGNDYLTGGAGDDVILGGAGNDKLKGRGGNDILQGEEGKDRLYGDDGLDVLIGGPGKDDLKGGKGDDQLFGGEDDDNLDGGKGSDFLAGGAGDDDLKSGSDGGSDGAGDNILVGGDGDDKLRGGKGFDLLIGGLGADKIEGGSHGHNHGHGHGGGDAGGDILIAGWTVYDDDRAALRSILGDWTAGWTAGLPYDDIVDDLVDDWLTPGETVFDDGVKDKVEGSNKARDLFFADLDKADGDDDKLKGNKKDTVIDLEQFLALTTP